MSASALRRLAAVALVTVAAAACSSSSPTAPTATASTGAEVTAPPQTPTARLLKTNYLTFGDSMTAGEVTVPVTGVLDAGGLPAFRLIVVPGASYPTQLWTILATRYPLDANRLVVTNAGRGGEWAADGARRLQEVLSAAHPDVVTLFEGANDLEALGARALPGAVAAVDTMTQYARGSGSDVFILSMVPSRPGGRLTLDEGLVAVYNDALRSLAAARQVTYVDIHTPLSASLATYIGVDGLHPTEAGYRRIAEVVADTIQAKYEAR